MDVASKQATRGKKGYLKETGMAWKRACRKDLAKASKYYTKKMIKQAHSNGYNRNSISRYGLKGDYTSKYITDHDYMLLAPYNNSFSKWLGDMLTSEKVLKSSRSHFRKIHYSIVRRNGATLIFNRSGEDRKYCASDILDTLREHGELELRPAYYASSAKRYVLSIDGEAFYVNGKRYAEKKLNKLLSTITRNYVIADTVDISYNLTKNSFGKHYIKVWLANDAGDSPVILSAVMNYMYNDIITGAQRTERTLIDLETGEFVLEGIKKTIDNWNEIKAELLNMSSAIPQISYFSTSIALTDENLFTYLHFSASPLLPELAFNDELNDYLIERVVRKASASRGKRGKIVWSKIKAKVSDKIVTKVLRKGIRPYMGKLWLKALWSDFLTTKDVSLGKKLWAWKRGFISYHTYQYGITKENYPQFLSDFDYYWLNRINGSYQGWINDKTTYRYILEGFNDCIPKYYFSCFRYNNGDNTMHFKPMWDCPADISGDFDGFIELLKAKGKLAVKPSAGTHGDGFYCMSYENGVFYANGEEISEAGIRDLMNARKSYYVVTEYLEMHDFLKAIYPKSVNTIRVMVINRHGYDPEIMQSYMRIGSSTTGFTDNVGYGGICVMVDMETGELIKPQTISKHIFYDCPVHPDTGTPIAGNLPNWQFLRNKVLDVARSMPELEYLGFDVTLSPTGIEILEINIHQDLHKANTFSPEIMKFFNEKIRRKKKTYRVK